MKEQLAYQPKPEIKWPSNGIVKVDSFVDFVYVMRKDGDFAMSPIAGRIADEYFIDEEQARRTLLEGYDTFFSQLSDILQWAYSLKGDSQLHLYAPDELAKEVKKKAGSIPIVSLDPLMNKGVWENKVSRGYYLSGRKSFGAVARPGADPLSKQAEEIKNSLTSSPAVVVEDDIFSGESVINSLIELEGIELQKLIPGIQVGKPEKLSQMGISVEPVVSYETTDGTDIFNKVDLGDPRDYLVGASGLVVKLPNGSYGRAPYILPFVSPTARASIPQEIEKEFSFKILQANLDFYKNVDEILGKPIMLKNMDPYFVVLMNEMFGVDSNTPMSQVVMWLMNNMDRLWEVTKSQGEFQERLADLDLPKNIVFVDVNGTLIPDGSKDGFIEEEDIKLLKQALAEAKEKGLSIGLCSDSPLEQLQEFAKKLGIDGPIIAENGNLVFNNGKVLIVNALDSIEALKSRIYDEAKKLNYQRLDDCIAPEFGGKKVEPNSCDWSFGANRRTSVTVFGPSVLIENLGAMFDGNPEYSVDTSPQYNYFAIHPGNNFKTNKGLTLNLISAYGYNVIMVGNSTSDWVESTFGVQCAFVANSRINNNIAEKAAFISDKPLVKGVVNILTNIK